MFNNVDLPQPDGPMTATNSPSSTVSDTFFKVTVFTNSVLKTFPKLSTTSFAIYSLLFLILYNIGMKPDNLEAKVESSVQQKKEK